MRSSAPRGSDSARWMPSASSQVRVAARRHAVSVTASGTRMFGSSSLVRPKSRRIGAALTLRLSTHAMRCGSTHPCTDDAMTARLCPLPITSDCPGASAPGSNRITGPNKPTPEIPPTRIKRDRWCGHAVQEYSNGQMGHRLPPAGLSTRRVGTLLSIPNQRSSPIVRQWTGQTPERSEPDRSREPLL